MDERCGFTPARRPTMQGDFSPRGCNDSASWTSARCKRLLRPVTSRLATLRKEAKFTINGSFGLDQDVSEASGRLVGNHDASIPTFPHRFSIDPDQIHRWQSDGPQKRIRRTYTSRSVTSNRKRKQTDAWKTLYQESTIRRVRPLFHLERNEPPMVAVFSALAHDPSQSQEASKQSTSRSERKAAKISRANFKTLAKTVRPTQWAIYDGMFTGLETLLNATVPTLLPRKTGTSSLFATSVRAIPRWMAQTEEEAGAIDPDHKLDIETLIFDQLEALSTSVDGVWKPFRDICRSQAVALLSDAIQEGLIPLSLADSLVHLLFDHGVIQGAESLVKAMLHTVTIIRDPDSPAETFYSHEISYTLQALHRLIKDDAGFLYETVTTMIEKDALSIQWCAHPDFVQMWNRVLQSITTSDYACAQAISLLETSVNHWGLHFALEDWHAASGDDSDINTQYSFESRDVFLLVSPLKDVILALLSVLLASGVRDVNGTAAILPGSSRQALEGVVLTLSSNCENDQSNDLGRIADFALLIARPNHSLSWPTAELLRYGNSGVFVDAMAKAIQDSAHLVAEATEIPEFETLRSLIGTSLIRPNDQISSRILHCIAARTARHFADVSGEQVHQLWAYHLEASHKHRPIIAILDELKNEEDVSVAEPLTILDLLEPELPIQQLRTVPSPPPEAELATTSPSTPKLAIAESFRWDKELEDFVVCSPIQEFIADMIPLLSEPSELSQLQTRFDFEDIVEHDAFDVVEDSSEDHQTHRSISKVNNSVVANADASSSFKSHSLPSVQACDGLCQLQSQDNSPKSGTQISKSRLGKPSRQSRTEIIRDAHTARLIQTSVHDLSSLSFGLGVRNDHIDNTSIILQTHNALQPKSTNQKMKRRHHVQQKASVNQARKEALRTNAGAINTLPRQDDLVRKPRTPGRPLQSNKTKFIVMDDDSPDELCM